MIVGQNGGAYLSKYFSNLIWLLLGLLVLLTITYLFLSYSILNKIDMRNGSILICLFTYVALVIVGSRQIGTKALTGFGAGGRYFMIIHVLVFVLLISLWDKIPQKRSTMQMTCTVLIIAFLTAGVLSDLYLPSKSSKITRSSWESFSRCMEENRSSCVAILPPGETQGSWRLIVGRI